MKVVAVFNIDEDRLKSTESTFEDEMGWVADSGIYIEDYIKINDDDTNKPKHFLVKNNSIEILEEVKI